MAAAAAAQEFEKAALLRDRLDAVRHVHERQAARIEGGEAFDVIGLHQGEPGANVQVFRVRDGAVVDRQAFYVDNAAGRDPAEVAGGVPPRVLLGRRVDPARDRRAARGGRRGGGAAGRAARRQGHGARREARPQASPSGAGAAQRRAGRAGRGRAPGAPQSSARIEALESLRDGLGLEGLPLRIECYDISNLGEQHVVGSMVVFEGGVAKKAHYRKFACATWRGRTTSR